MLKPNMEELISDNKFLLEENKRLTNKILLLNIFISVIGLSLLGAFLIKELLL